MERNKIYVAEDDTTTLELTTQTVGRHFPRYEIESFEEGGELSDRLENGDVPLMVITDNEMPNMLGCDIIKKYASDERFKETKFILAYGGDVSIGEEAIRDGAFSYLQKPFSIIRQLVPVIEDALKE